MTDDSVHIPLILHSDDDQEIAAELAQYSGASLTPHVLDGVEIINATHSDPETGPYVLTGLTKRLRDMPCGTGILIPRRDGWTPAVMRQLRNSIGVVCNRLAKTTPDRFTTKTTTKGLQIWRLPKE